MGEEVQKDEGSHIINKKPQSVPNNPYSNLQREITEEDLKTPAVQRILLGEVDKLESKLLVAEDELKGKVAQFESLLLKFHEVDKEKAILEEKVKKSKAQEILYSFCISTGSIIIGFSRQVWEQGLGVYFLVIGLLLIIGGLISKAVQWK